MVHDGLVAHCVCLLFYDDSGMYEDKYDLNSAGRPTWKLRPAKNRISALPDDIGKLVFLVRLELDRNQLVTLPESFGELRALEKLDLKHNMLKSLPESFGKLTALMELDLENNRFEKAADVPVMICCAEQFCYTQLWPGSLSLGTFCGSIVTGWWSKPSRAS